MTLPCLQEQRSFIHRPDPSLDWIKMGKMLAKLFGKKDMRILMLGLDAAGKTSILNHSFFAHFNHVITQAAY